MFLLFSSFYLLQNHFLLYKTHLGLNLDFIHFEILITNIILIASVNKNGKTHNDKATRKVLLVIIMKYITPIEYSMKFAHIKIKILKNTFLDLL